MFLQVSVILSTGGEYLTWSGGCTWPGPGGCTWPGPGVCTWSREVPDHAPPRTRYTPPLWQVHPPGLGTPPRPGTPPSCRACWEIRSTRGRYACYWNAILFNKVAQWATKFLYLIILYILVTTSRINDQGGKTHSSKQNNESALTFYRPPSQADTTHGQEDTSPPGRRPLQRTVRILLECVLVETLW